MIRSCPLSFGCSANGKVAIYVGKGSIAQIHVRSPEEYGRTAPSLRQQYSSTCICLQEAAVQDAAGSLIQGTDGSFYGAAFNGGPANKTVRSVYRNEHLSGLLLATNGNFYGLRQHLKRDIAVESAVGRRDLNRAASCAGWHLSSDECVRDNFELRRRAIERDAGRTR
jgi:hypothetical protein